MDIKERNKQIKRILSKEYGAKNVSVTGATGTATGWAHITINAGNRVLAEGEQHNQFEKDLINETSERAEELIKDVEFYTYTDDMGIENKEYILNINLSESVSLLQAITDKDEDKVNEIETKMQTGEPVRII